MALCILIVADIWWLKCKYLQYAFCCKSIMDKDHDDEFEGAKTADTADYMA